VSELGGASAAWEATEDVWTQTAQKNKAKPSPTPHHRKACLFIADSSTQVVQKSVDFAGLWHIGCRGKTESCTAAPTLGSAFLHHGQEECVADDGRLLRAQPRAHLRQRRV
jgi:hypothetical protein